MEVARPPLYTRDGDFAIRLSLRSSPAERTSLDLSITLDPVVMSGTSSHLNAAAD